MGLPAVFGGQMEENKGDLLSRGGDIRNPCDAHVGSEGIACWTYFAVAPAQRIGHPQTGAIRLSKNGALSQSGDLSQMIWKVAEIISELSRYFLLCPGDLIFTGTPSGVGPVQRGDELFGEIEGIGSLSLRVE